MRVLTCQQAWQKRQRRRVPRPKTTSARRLATGEYLEAGVRLVWVIDPTKREAAIYRSLMDVRALKPTESLDGEGVLPGFRCSLAEILK